MSQQSLFIVDPSTLVGANVTAAGTSDGGSSLQTLTAQYNSSAPTLSSGALTFLQTDVNGNLKTTASIMLTYVANPGAVVPTQTAWMGASDGTDLRGLLVESSSASNLRTSLYFGSTEMKIANDGYTAVHQADSPWVVSGTVAVSSVSGTVAVTQSTSPWVVSGTVAATQSGTWTVQQGGSPWGVIGTTATNSAAGNAVQVLPAQFHVTGTATGLTGPVDGYRFAGTSVTDTNTTFMQTDGYGRLEVSPARAMAYAYENRSSQTITLKTTSGVLRKVIVGNSGKAGALVTFFDNTSAAGTVIAKINTSSILGQISFDIPFAVGLTYTTNAISVIGDVTVTFE